jgi:hypothetical protein
MTQSWRCNIKRLIASSIIACFLITVAVPAFAVDPQKDTSLRKGETRQTLDPKGAPSPKVREAYQAAKDIPWVLDSIYCYCMCKENQAFKHISLLSCYVDGHAAS